MLQNTSFQAVVQLTLKFREATDQVQKAYLARRLTVEEGANSDLRLKLEKLEDAFHARTTDLERAHLELRKIKDENEKTVNEILNEERRRLNQEKEAAMEKERQITKEFETEKKEMSTHYERTIRELQNKTEHLTKANQDLTEIRIGLEAKERELSGKVRTYENEVDLLQKEIQNVRIGNKELDSIRFTNEKQITELRVKVEGLEAQVRNKEELASKHNELFENASKQKVNSFNVIN